MKVITARPEGRLRACDMDKEWMLQFIHVSNRTGRSTLCEVQYHSLQEALEAYIRKPDQTVVLWKKNGSKYLKQTVIREQGDDL